MDPTKMTMVQQILIGAAVGLVVGLVPLIAGILKGKAKLGLTGFVASIAGGSVLALLLAVPMSAIFTWLIFRKSKAISDDS
jgi:hypothetical protein